MKITNRKKNMKRSVEFIEDDEDSRKKQKIYLIDEEHSQSPIIDISMDEERVPSSPIIDISTEEERVQSPIIGSDDDDGVKPIVERSSLYDLNFAVSSNIGSRKYQEDTFITIPITQFWDSNGRQRTGSLFVIFDGHGGPQVSDFLKDEFAYYFKDIPLTDKNIKRAFLELDQQFDEAKNVGSTCVAVFILEKDMDELEVICANSGDSRAILTSRNWYSNLSFDHKPKDLKERKRIENHGNIVCERGRINSKLIVSRAFGDYQYKDTKNGKFTTKETSVIVRPQIIRKPVLLTERMVDHYIVLGSDGMWDVMSCLDVWKFMATTREKTFKKVEIGNTSSFGDEEQLLKCAEHLIYKSMSKYKSEDNCTVIIVKIAKSKNGIYRF